MWKIKQYSRHENKVNEYQVLYCNVKQSKTVIKAFPFMSNLQIYYHLKLTVQKVDQHTGGKCLVHGTKRCNDNQLLSLELPCRVSY